MLGSVAFDNQPSGSENASSRDLAGAQVALCGFPRTGTTFVQRAINIALDDEGACWKNHDPLSISVNTRAALPTLITLRDPLSTVLSWSLYHHDDPSPALFSARIAAYLAWHREVRRRVTSPWVSVIDFDEFVACPSTTLSSVLTLPHPISVTGEAVTQAVRQENHRTGLGLNQGNTPHEDRVDLRARYLEFADTSTNRRLLAKATTAYESLRK